MAFPKSVSAVARSFIEACLQIDPRDRPTAMELLAHPLLQAYKRAKGPAVQVSEVHTGSPAASSQEAG